MNELADIAVIGAGPAGANGALAVAKLGFSALLIDEQPKPGGQVWRAKSDAILEAPGTPETVAGDLLRRRINNSAIAHFGSTRVWQIERHGGIWELQLQNEVRSSRVRARALVLATGAQEYVQPVPGWTTPGVLGLAGATALFKQELAVPGRKVIVSGTGPLVFLVAAEVLRLGGRVAAVITPNSHRDWMRTLSAMISNISLLSRGMVWLADLMLSRVPVYWRHGVTRIVGDTSVSGVEIRKLSADWSPVGCAKWIEGDSLCLGNGLAPTTEACQLAGLPLVYKSRLGGWVPRLGADGTTGGPGLFVCGDGSGMQGAAAAELHGRLAGLTAAAYLGADTKTERNRLRRMHARAARFGIAMTKLNMPRQGLLQLTGHDTIVCRCEGVCRAQIESEIENGAGSLQTLKSRLRVGMGPCGGRFCQSVVARILAEKQGRAIVDFPPTRARPPMHPLPVAAIKDTKEYTDLQFPKPAPL